MAITLTGTGGLFTRLGRFGRIAQVAREFQSATLPTATNSLMAQYDGARTVVDTIPTTSDSFRRSTISQFVAQIAGSGGTNTLLDMMLADKPAKASTLSVMLQELIDQMNAASATVKRCAVAITATAKAGKIGDGVIVTSVRRGDGLLQENLIPETVDIVCTTDSRTGGATAGLEQFGYTGEPGVQNVWDSEYPIGSGQTVQLTAVSAQTDAGANVLTNGAMEAFSVTNVPDRWAIATGVAGTDFQRSTAAFFDGSSSFQLNASATLVSFSQQFDSTGGTTAKLSPLTQYAIQFWLRGSAAPSGGVLTVDLVDGSGTVTQDAQGVNNSFTVNLTTLTTTWASFSGVFRTPKVMPDVIRLRFRITTTLAGASVQLDRVAMNAMTQLYAGGPFASIFSGQTRFAQGDGWEVVTTNDYGGASYLSTFQQLFERLFSMRQLGLLLPSASSPTIPDTLITAA